jgi:DNA-binding FrmR family transcriptional regulator
MKSPSYPVLPAAWAEVLNRVEQALDQASAEAARALESLRRTEDTMTESASVAGALERLDAGLERLRHCVARAEEGTAGTDAALQLSEEVLRRWLAQSELAGRRLADAATHGVS